MNESNDLAERPPSTDIESSRLKKPKYPLHVFFIISNEFCERFMFYGMRTILALYMTQKLLMDNDSATIVYHATQMMSYFMCVVGAILSDTWLGRFTTILCLSVVYAVGSLSLAISTIPNGPLPQMATLYVALLLISIGSGGIKPCVAAFGGDQFKLPAQAVQLATYFSLFYFTINAGAMISSAVTPIFREDVHCFGETDCYSLAFGVSAGLMVISIGVFLLGKPLYRMTSPSGNVLVKVAKCIMTAISTKKQLKSIKRRDHFLDYAIETHGPELVRDTKILLRILVLYLPLPLFWTLFDQQGSRWLFQATKMDGDIGFYTIKPDQITVLNPLLVLLCIPLFDAFVLPAIAKIGINTSLRKLTVGGLLAALAFVFAASVQLKLDETSPILPNTTHSQLRLFNGYPCEYYVQSNIPGHENFTLKAFDAFQERQLPLVASDHFDFRFQRLGTESMLCPDEFNRSVDAGPNVAVSLFVDKNAQLTSFKDNPSPAVTGNPLIRFLASSDKLRNLTVIETKSNKSILNTNTTDSLQHEIVPGLYTISIGGDSVGSFSVKQGSVSTIIINTHTANASDFNVVEVVPANSLSMMWIVPQYAILTIGETIFAVTGLEFSYAQAPKSMKSVLQACWLLTVAMGNAILMVIVEIKLFESQANEFLFFAAIMVLDMCIFMVLAHRYKNEASDNDRMEQLPLKCLQDE